MCGVSLDYRSVSKVFPKCFQIRGGARRSPVSGFQKKSNAEIQRSQLGLGFPLPISDLVGLGFLLISLLKLGDSSRIHTEVYVFSTSS